MAVGLTLNQHDLLLTIYTYKDPFPKYGYVHEYLGLRLHLVFFFFLFFGGGIERHNLTHNKKFLEILSFLAAATPSPKVAIETLSLRTTCREH